MLKKLIQAAKEFNFGICEEVPKMPTFGKLDSYNDLKIEDGRRNKVDYRKDTYK